jgi:hypothetical protein
MDKISDLAAKLAPYLRQPRWHYLNDLTKLTSTSWDGDGYSTTAKTLIDLSAVFGAPANIKAVYFRVAVRDEASASGDYWIILGTTTYSGAGPTVPCLTVNDRYNRVMVKVPCDQNGDVYYQTNASGTGTLDVSLQIWGYYI